MFLAVPLEGGILNGDFISTGVCPDGFWPEGEKE